MCVMHILQQMGVPKFMNPGSKATVSHGLFFGDVVLSADGHKESIKTHLGADAVQFDRMLSSLQTFANFGADAQTDNEFEIHEEVAMLRGRVRLVRDSYCKMHDDLTSALLDKLHFFCYMLHQLVQGGFVSLPQLQVKAMKVFKAEARNDALALLDRTFDTIEQEIREDWNDQLQEVMKCTEEIDLRKLV